MNNPMSWRQKAADDREGVGLGQGALMQDWSGFFRAELGAAAALAGLVIVAISINVSRILSDPSLPGRAAETLVSPSGVLIVCSFLLVPHQPRWVLGGEVTVTGAMMAVG